MPTALYRVTMKHFAKPHEFVAMARSIELALSLSRPSEAVRQAWTKLGVKYRFCAIRYQVEAVIPQGQDAPADSDIGGQSDLAPFVEAHKPHDHKHPYRVCA